MKQHNGHIQAYSEIGEGTVFKVYMPTVDCQVPEASSSVQDPVNGGREMILVAEDDDAIRKLTVLILEKAGYTVLAAGNGEEAVQLFKARSDEIALAILDVMMPGLGGRKVHEMIKKTHPGMPVLFSSGTSHDVTHTQYILNEQLPFIQKPYGSDVLLRRIREMLDVQG